MVTSANIILPAFVYLIMHITRSVYNSPCRDEKTIFREKEETKDRKWKHAVAQLPRHR